MTDLSMAPSQDHVRIRIARAAGRHAAEIPLPVYATAGSSGMDIAAAVEQEQLLKPGERALIPTGFHVEIPPGFEAQVRSRSGLALRHGIGVLNAPGTIDSDYRGEVKVLLVNLGREEFTVRRGDRIAQLVVAPVVRAVWEEAGEIAETPRGAGGFGHTGK